MNLYLVLSHYISQFALDIKHVADRDQIGAFDRLSAQAAQAAPNGDNGPRLGGVSSSQPPNVVDSVQASIEAAKAIAARMGGSGNLNVLGSSQSNVTSGQWAWGRG